MPIPFLGACAGAHVADVAGAEAVGGGARVAAAIHALFPHTIGVLAGFFGFTAMAVGATEMHNSKAEEAANVGGAGLGFMDEQRLKEKADREEAEMEADRKKVRMHALERLSCGRARRKAPYHLSVLVQAAAKLAAGKGILDPTNMSITDAFYAITGTGPA